MIQRDPSTSSQSSESHPQANANPVEDMQRYPSGKTDETINDSSFFTVTESVTFKPMTTPERGIGQLPPGMARIVSAIGLSAALLLPISGCSDFEESSVPCPVPTSTPSGMTALNSTPTPTITCRTSSGRRYIWVRNRGGWVESDDGVHPRQGARGVGVDDGYHNTSTGGEHSGVGSGRSGSGHGGGEGG